MGVIRHWLSYHIGTSTGPAYIDAVARAELRRGLAHVVAAAHWLLADVDFASRRSTPRYRHHATFL